MKTVKIKGKDYVEVKERIKFLAFEQDKPYSIQTEVTYYPERPMWVVKAILTIYEKDRDLVYNGHAQEVESDDYRQVNYASALENAETSAVGRACAMAGIGTDPQMASADEVRKNENRPKTEPKPKTVQNSTVNIDAELISQAINAAVDAKDLKSLQDVWDKNKTLHTHTRFKAVVTNRKKEITGISKKAETV